MKKYFSVPEISVNCFAKESIITNSGIDQAVKDLTNSESGIRINGLNPDQAHILKAVF